MTTTPFSTTDNIVVKRQLSMMEAYTETISDESLIGQLVQMDALSEIKALQKGKGDSVRPVLRGLITGKGYVNNQENTTGRKRNNIYDDEIKLFELSQVVEAETKGTISAQMTEFGDMEDVSVDSAMEWVKEHMALGVVRKFCGVVHASVSYNGTTFSSADDLLQVNAGSVPTAPAATRMFRPNASVNTTDELVNADTTATFKLSHLAEFSRRARTLRPYMKPLNIKVGDHKVNWVCLLHPDAWYNAQIDVTDSFQFRDIQLSTIQAGNSKVIEYGDGFIFMDIQIILTDKCPRGVHSSTAAELTNTRRGVFLGKNAGSIAFGQGFTVGRESAPGFGMWDELTQVGRIKAYRAGCVWGMDKHVFNSLDYSSVTFTHYVAQ